RLDAEAVTREEQRFAIAIPQREREHAAQALYAVFAPRLPCVHDRLGIAACTKAVTECRELRDQRLVVVNLAVVDDADTAVLVVKWLLPGRQIDDRQPAVAEAD